MGYVNRNMADMPVPDFAYTDRHDGRVFILSLTPEGKTRKKTIGYMTVSERGSERMIPNQYFMETYPDIYQKSYPEQKIPFHEISIGMYTLTLSIAEKTGLYDELKQVYGPIYANSILDYAMYSVLYHSSVTQVYEQMMQREVLFSDKVHSDSWYADFFSQKLTEDSHHQFRIRWVQHLKDEGRLNKVWLAIDGSNNDCEARASFLAKHGFPKSHNQNKSIVGYMWAVDATTGLPVTYFVYEGNVPDSQAFQKIATFLSSFSIEIEGVILDRGFAVDKVFETIEEKGWKYVIMLTSDTYGHNSMIHDHSEDIRWKSEHVLKNDAIFGISDRKKIFSSHARESEICLFFDGSYGSMKSVRLIKKILSAKSKAEYSIAQGRKVTIEKSLQKYLNIVECADGRRTLKVNYDVWDQDMNRKGFHSIAVSDGIDPERTHELYNMRGTSEIQYSILKSQEGYDTTRVHNTSGIYSKFAIVFIASLLRHEIETSCKKLELDTNPTIQSLKQITLLRTAENKYEAVRNLSTDIKKIFSYYSIDQDDIERLARDFNERNRTDQKNPVRKLPTDKTPIMKINSHKTGRHNSESLQTTRISEAENFSDHSTEIKTKNLGGRPIGKKDSKPRKPRSDKGKLRGKRTHN